MKIRIKGDSIRYRLTKSDIALLKAEGKVEESTQVNNETVFYYALERKADLENTEVSFTDRGFTITIPDSRSAVLTDTPEIGIYNTLSNDNKNGLKVIIEKDLVCLDETDEDQSDMYDNPKTQC